MLFKRKIFLIYCVLGLTIVFSCNKTDINTNTDTQMFTGRCSSHENSANIQQIGNDNTGSQTGNGRNIYADFGSITSFGDSHSGTISQTAPLIE